MSNELTSQLSLFTQGLARFFGVGLRVPETGIQPTGPSGSVVSSIPLVATDERALSLSTVWACVRLLTQTYGMLPFDIYRKVGRGLKLADDHPLHFLLALRPNPWQTPVEFRETMMLHLVLRGNSYAYIIRGVDGVTPVSLIPLPSDQVEVDVLKDQSVVYRYASERGLFYIAPENMLHVRLMGPGRYVGLSPLSYARFTMGAAMATEESAARYFVNGSKPSGVLSMDKILTKEQRAQIREKFKELYEGGDNAWKLFVLEGGMKYDQISLSPEDSQMLETRAHNQASLCQFFGVPPHLVGITDKSTSWGTGLEQQNMAFLTYSFQPYVTRMEMAMENKLLGLEDFGQFDVKTDLRQLVRADSAARSAFYSTMTQNGVMTRNEAREQEGMEPSAEAKADELTCQSNLIPLSKLGEKPEPKPGAFGAPGALGAPPGTLPGDRRQTEEAEKMSVHIHVPEFKINPVPVTVEFRDPTPISIAPPVVHILPAPPPSPALINKTITPNDDGSWTVKEIAP